MDANELFRVKFRVWDANEFCLANPVEPPAGIPGAAGKKVVLPEKAAPGVLPDSVRISDAVTQET